MLLLSLFLACGSEVPESVQDQVPPKTEQKSDVAANKKMEHANKDHAKMEHSKMEHKGMTEGEVGTIPEGAKVFFVEPKDGATVSSEFTVKMGVEGMKVQPAGEVVDGTGHHHIIVDKGGVPKGVTVPADAQHIHFGKGQTETKLTLEKGKHTLRLQFANGVHASYGDQLSASIEVTVE